MAVVINGTTGITSVNGSASAPSVTGTDTDTGIVYGTNTLSLATGGTTAVTVDSSQNVGIGTGSPATRLQIKQSTETNGISLVDTYTSNEWTTNHNGSNSYTWRYNAAERMRIDSSGNVGIGTSSPSSGLVPGLVIGNGTDNKGITLWGTTTTQQNIAFTDTASAQQGLIQYDHGGDYMRFFTASSERMRIDSSGRMQLGTTSSKYSSSFTIVKGGNAYNITSSVSSTASSGHIVFENNNADAVGTIFTAGSSTAYNTTSDYRLKENVTPMVNALAKVALLKPVTYTWKVDGSDGEGFIAHELAEVFPQAVTGEKDAVNEDGKPQYQGIDVSFLVGTLTAAIQEQQAIIEQLRADVAQLKGQA